MKLYFVRHGQSVANVNHTHAGQMDSPLTENGRQDAMKAGKLLKTISFDKVYSSDLSRAKTTQEIAYPCDNVTVTQLLREINVGKGLENKTFEVCLEEFGPEYVTNRRAFNLKPYGGEDYEMLEERAKQFLNMVIRDKVECVVAFSHGGFIDAVLGCVLNCKVTTQNTLCDNCGISIFEYSNGTWKLRKWNLTADDVFEEYV